MSTVNVEAFEPLFDMAEFSEETPCGTSHCAAGWAAVDPWFQENTAILDQMTRKGEPKDSWDSRIMESIFGVNERTVDSLFFATDFTKEEVIATIDEIIAGAIAEVSA